MELTILEEEAGVRIDKILTQKLPEYSRTYFHFLLKEGAVLLNGQAVKKRHPVAFGDEIEISFIATPEMEAIPEDIPLDIVYEDEHILCINKPPGMVVHPAPGHPRGTFVNALLHHCKALPQSDTLRPGIVHRLDKDTSGLLLAAKTTQAHQRLIEMFSNQQIQKTYLAITLGNPKVTRIEGAIKRHPVNRKLMHIDPEGRPALTEIEILKVEEKLSYLICRPKTGRTHQIRVHLKSKNAPILGDPIYGQAHPKRRLQLHAYALEFAHPITNQPLALKTAIPDDMQDFPTLNRE